jgi:flagellar motor switch/type III secretory pathway protein FliN
VVILANNKAVARGEIVVQGDRIGVTVTEMLKGQG